MRNRAFRLTLCLLAAFALGLGATLQGKDWSKKELRKAQAKVLALGKLVAAPQVWDDAGRPAEIVPGEMQSIYFDALEYEGKPTRAFALVQVPEGASAEKPVPGIVLVHGGGGTAFEEWVKLWVDRGYAAISIAVEGQTNVRNEAASDEDNPRGWQRHAWSGPRRVAIYGDSDKPIEQQWMYHAVADSVLANSLMRSLPFVDAERTGIMGISWGGVITSTVIGIDTRFAFAIPTYGCGHKFDSENQYGKALGDNEVYKQVWDPMVRLKRAKMPVQWLSWPGDKHFPMDAFAASYREASGPRLVTLIPGMKHGHGAGWRPEDSYAFADSVVKEGQPWARQLKGKRVGDRYEVVFESDKPIEGAYLVSTLDSGYTGNRNWTQSEATLENVDGQWIATATLPHEATAWFVNLTSGSLVASSDYQER
ncbi:acetylxylan esterase [Pelagicoccus sp. SDUM812005]|uniref:alpha/beta hydrolase family protein n=1 Tax=Pelagicoccus sp. SDUM812005 TaxID=3041257 RepID=UPI00280CA2B9|nr:acetylxylan esterase [Pelagicoccus sp. SDUM812005]MDQ8180246.1 acetylxylan esterase [Pelagicoccus sp. SDUM812005]